MKWIIRVTILFFFVSLPAKSQLWKLRRWELTGGIGTGHYFGDIGGVSPGENILGLKDFQLLSTRPAINAGMRYKVFASTSLKAELTSGWLHGRDAGGINDARGIVFNTYIFEPSVRVEQEIIRDKSERSYLMMKGRGIVSFTSSISLYIFGGVGGSLFFPKAKEDPYSRIDLSASKFTVVYPVGLGLKYPLDANFSMGFDVGYRFTMTDSLDGFTSPFSKYKDHYYFTSLHLVWKLKTSRKGLPIFRL